MRKKIHPADEATAAAIASADHFQVSLLVNGSHIVHPLKTLEQARQAGGLLEETHQNGKQSLVYAVNVRYS